MDRITYRDDYDEHKELALFVERSYVGGGEYREGRYLVRRDLESDEKYEKRLRAATYTNYCAPVQDTYLDFLFGAQWTRDFSSLEADPVWQSFYADVDGAGRGYLRFWHRAMLRASLQGFCAVVVDKPAVSAATRAEEFAAGARPYCAVYDGLDIVRLDIERHGWRQEIIRAVLAEPAPDETVEWFREWTPEAWRLIEQPKTGEPTVLDEGPNPLGRLPVVILQAQAGGLLEPRPDLKDIAAVARRIYNIDSDIEEVRANTAFPFLEVPEKRDEHGELIVIGSGNALTYDPENPTARHTYVEPSHTSIQVMLQERDRALEDLRFLSRLPFDVTGQARQVPSGYALRVLSEKLNALLRSKAIQLMHAEKQVIELFAAWQEQQAPDVTIDPPDHFGIDDVNEELDTAIKAQTLISSATFRQELAGRIARAVLGDDLPPEIAQAIEEEVVGNNALRGIIGADQGA